MPFFFHLSEHLIHTPYVRTPDSLPGSDGNDFYNDYLQYLDKTVGKLVGELNRLGIREKTVIVLCADNGTSRVAYEPRNNTRGLTGKINGRAVNGQKGELLEGGTRVPLIANWKGTLNPGGVRSHLIDFSDFLATFADLANAPLPNRVFDGRSFAPQLRGNPGNPRESIFVQLGNSWFARERDFKLSEKGELYHMNDAPFTERLIRDDANVVGARAARGRLQATLNELNPAGG